MELSIYQIIQGPVVSDKAYKLNKKLNKLVIKVHPQANKPSIAQAIEKLFNLKVKNVRTIVRKGKRRRVKKKIVVDPLIKKAIVTLKEGYSLDLIGQAGASVDVRAGQSGESTSSGGE